MIDYKIELGKNFHVITIQDFCDIDMTEIKELAQKKNLKIQAEVNNLFQLQKFEESGLLSLNKIHISLQYTKQTFITQNITDIINNTLVKSLVVKDMKIYLNLYTINQVDKFIVENNTKVIERIKYMHQDVQIHSKVHEILYQTNLILKSFKQNEDFQKNLKDKIHTIYKLSNKM